MALQWANLLNCHLPAQLIEWCIELLVLGVSFLVGVNITLVNQCKNDG